MRWLRPRRRMVDIQRVTERRFCSPLCLFALLCQPRCVRFQSARCPFAASHPRKAAPGPSPLRLPRFAFSRCDAVKIHYILRSVHTGQPVAYVGPSLPVITAVNGQFVRGLPATVSRVRNREARGLRTPFGIGERREGRAHTPKRSCGKESGRPTPRNVFGASPIVFPRPSAGGGRGACRAFALYRFGRFSVSPTLPRNRILNGNPSGG